MGDNVPSIKDIETRLFHVPCLVSDEEFASLKEDPRKGVQNLILKWKKKQQQIQALKQKYCDMSTYEDALRDEGVHLIAGIDEAGRGPLAGPVVAGAVILKEDSFLPGLNDSKQLNEAKREIFYNRIWECAVSVGVGIVEAAEIDHLNIYQASKKAMLAAIGALHVVPEHLLCDAMELPLPIPQTSLTKGDSRSISIAAGSIIAKVTRDRMMRQRDVEYPQYGFAHHFGYATAEHLQHLKNYGVCREHRRSFAPVRDLAK